MTIARKIAALFVCSGLFIICIATGYVAQREYQIALDSVVASSLAGAQNRPDLQLYVYSQDKTRLKQSLGKFFDSNAVFAAVTYSNLGNLITQHDSDSATTHAFPAFNTIRAENSVTETSMVALDRKRDLTGVGFWSTLRARDTTAYLTIPIFSAVDPTQKSPDLSDFFDSLIQPEANNSLIVIGYLQLAIDRKVLLRDIQPTVTTLLIGSLILLLMCAIPLYLILTKITTPLAQLTRLAGQIVSGNMENKIELKDCKELKNIANVLNSVVENSATHSYESGLEHRLLLLTADERASRLSMREEELSKATEEISATREELHRLANYDHLTSLPNRQLFTEQLTLLLRQSARNAKPLALMFINLNNFHRVNESLGRSAGDMLLQEVSKRLVGCLRSSDVLAHYVDSENGLSISRLGGDEFAVVLSQLAEIGSAALVAQRITEQLAEPMTIEGHELVVKPSIGIAVAPRNGMDVEDLLKSAATAMHHAKVAIESNFLFYQDDMIATGQDDLKMESELRKAIDRNEISLHYQPQVDTTNGSIICAEALLRWEHPEFGSVSPTRFIHLAERIGLIWELGDWVLVEACRQMNVFKDQGVELPRIAINISPQQLKPAFITRLIEVLENADMSPAKLELGLSEAILMDNDSNILKFIQELKETGVYLSLENFGTSHAPISYLSRHPLDEIKIDRSFVINCDKRKDAARLVKAIIAMAKSLGLKTVAEGVETESEYRFLSENGVTIMRGYLFSKALPAKELQQLLIVPWHFMTQLQRMALIADLGASADRP